jgi:hypothetical protein
MRPENERGRPGQGGTPSEIADDDKDDYSTRYKYPAPDFVPNYGAAISCPLACSPGCPWICPLVVGS